MNLRTLVFTLVLLVTSSGFAQSGVTEIETDRGIRYTTTSIDYPVAGTYFFKGAEPTILLNGDGTGVYQSHDLTKRTIVWGLECFEGGIPMYKKGFDNIKYYLFYKFTSGTDSGMEELWTRVDYTVHLKSGMLFINGERGKSFTPKL